MGQTVRAVNALTVNGQRSTVNGQRSTVMRKSFVVWLGVAAVMFAVAPILIVRAPYESTMGLVQKIFYYHAPLGMMMFLSAFVSGIAAGIFIFNGRAAADRVSLAAAEITVLFGSLVLVTGPLWARKAWGVWWQWDARLTSSLLLWMIFVAYLLVRRYGGPGSDKLSAAVALFGMANVPFVYMSVNVWRTLHPKTSVVPTLQPGCGRSSGSAWRRSRCCTACCWPCVSGSRRSRRKSSGCTWSSTINRSCRDDDENRRDAVRGCRSRSSRLLACCRASAGGLRAAATARRPRRRVKGTCR